MSEDNTNRHSGADADIAQVLGLDAQRHLRKCVGAVAALSLLVDGIGMMYIMLVSVTERTGEIGILLAIAASLGLAGLLRVPFVLDLIIVLLAFLFSAVVGVSFGFFPARKAARLARSMPCAMNSFFQIV